MFKNLFKRKPAIKHKLTIRPLGETIDVPERNTLLDAALDHELLFPHSCCSGECGSCACRLVAGEVSEEIDTSHVLSPAQKSAGYILACQSLALGDVVVEIPGLDGWNADHPVVETEGTISRLEALTHDILELTVDVAEPVEFTAGQYAELAVPGVVEEARSYSFANPPAAGPSSQLVFHVRLVPGGAFTGWLHGEDRQGEKLRVVGPHGQFALRSSDDPILCVAGGSGMAPIKALLEQALAEGVERDVIYYFGARSQRDLYCVDEMAALKQAWPRRFDFVPVLSEEPADSDWSGERGLVTEPLQRLGADIPRHQAYLCGPPGMLDAALEILDGAGLGVERIFCDKFLDKRHTADLEAAE